MIFVNSMSDLFHEEVPQEFILSVFRTMVRGKHHLFQILTKRSRRLVEPAPKLPKPEIGRLVEGWDYVAVSQARGRVHKSNDAR
jgi:protein gp37